MSIFEIGSVHESNKYGKYVILERIRNRYKIRFLDTGFENTLAYSSLYHGQARDPYKPIYSKVGYLGSGISTVMHKKELSVWRGMLSRCYDDYTFAYENYGRVGVYVCDRWHCFKNFVEDLPKIEGYDEDLFYEGKLHLDKDVKANGGVGYYSLETCKFLSIRENFDEMMTRRKKKTSSKYIGVTKLYDGKWQASISYNGYNIYIGRFSTEKLAYDAYLRKQKELFGDEKTLNKE